MTAVKTFLKYLLAGVGLILTLPLSLPAWIEIHATAGNFFFRIGTHLLALLPGSPGIYLRTGFYIITLEKFHPTAIVNFGSFFSSPAAIMHERSGTGAFCILGMVEIGRNVRLASRVSIVSGLHEHGNSDHREEADPTHVQEKRVLIGEGCWIGEGAVVADHVGANSIVAIGAIVTKPIPEWSLAMGNPARIVRNLKPERASTGEPDSKTKDGQADRSTSTLN